MKVKCIHNDGTGLLDTTIESGLNIEVTYPIDIGDLYVVYGQCIYMRNGKYPILKYLIKGSKENLPSWYPAELFEVVDSLLYYEWYYSYTPKMPLVAIWGYEEMVMLSNHYDDLIERKDEAIRIFLQRKKEIDDFFQ